MNRVNLDIIGDYSQILRDRLIFQVRFPKVDVDRIADNDKLLLAYFRTLRRFVAPVPRDIHKARDFVCPTEYHDALTKIECKIRRGDSINPHLSRKLLEIDYNDLLLNDWGIQHLHLGTREYNTGKHKGFIQGTRELLYVYFDQECAYFIKVLGHSDFTSQILLQTIHDNWPNVLASYHNPHITGDHLTDKQIRELRRKNLNYCVALSDGTSYMAVGGGIIFSGDNVFDVMRTNYLHHWARQQTEKVLENMPGMIERLKQRGMEFSDPITLRLKILDDDEQCWVLDDDRNKFRVPLLSPWQ